MISRFSFSSSGIERAHWAEAHPKKNYDQYYNFCLFFFLILIRHFFSHTYTQ